jgi:hypothetical protein
MEAEFDDDVRAPKKKKLSYVRELDEPYSVTLNEFLTVSVVSKDITKMEVDAIINPSDTRLAHKYALSKKIMESGGQELKKMTQVY